MKGKGIIQLLVAILVIAAVGFVAIFGIGANKSGSINNVRLGLDLAGGVSVTYETVKEDPTANELSDTVYKMQLRAQSMSTESQVYPEGDRRVTVAIPDVDDADAVLAQLGSAGNIYFIYAVGPSGTQNVKESGIDPETGDLVYELTRPMSEIIESGDVVIDGSDISGAEPNIIRNEVGITENIVELNFNSAGASKFASATSYAYQFRDSAVRDFRNCIAIVYDNKVVSCPGVASVISDGKATISGQESFEESQNLATTIRIGALPLELSVLRYYVEGAQLGADALKNSLIAGIIGLALIVLFMIIKYRIPGLASALALVFYTGLMVICLNLFEVTLTLPGIAGIILSIGMAVDANVIIFTRIQEELGSGKTVRSSIKLGFSKALSAIIDGNVTTIIAAIVLYFLGSGTVKGFAQTLAIGIILSMLTALFVTKFILDSFFKLGANGVKCYGEKKDKKSFGIVKNFGKFSIISGVIILAGIITVVVNSSTIGTPFNYGLDFSGGTATTAVFDGSLPSGINKDLETKIQAEIGELPLISTVESQNMVTIRTTELSTDNRAKVIDLLTNDYNINEKNITTESVGATVSGEMKKDALVAVIVATICMLIYIWFRFKNINFAAASVAALVHDVLVVLTVYAIGRSFISVGNTFIACLLTIVGYSINATIVIFDRIRENMKEKLSKESVSDVVDKSITQTFTRSIYTSLTTLVTVVLLAIMGDTSVKEFAIPLIAGIVCGTFSSVCLASGFWYTLQKKLKKVK
ncbi:MAG: protein translocase subunit SecD [Lachnospiraceae bacterium]|nr:protein translocase subunit SecD [Lachnospiraceae bacterium]